MFWPTGLSGSVRQTVYIIIFADKERERVLEKQRKELHKRERNELREEKARLTFDPETMEDEHQSTTPAPAPPAQAAPVILTQPRVSNVLAHDISHREPVSLLHYKFQLFNSKNTFTKTYLESKRSLT